MEVNEKIRCYRYELGNIMDKIGSSYFKMMEKILEACIKSNKDIEKKFQNRIDEY